jgi:starvation-inducible DNA-binding protein
MELHKLFENHYGQVADAIDEIAERVSQLGGMAIGTTSEFARLSSLKESPGKNPANNMDMVKELLEDHEAIIRGLRDGIDKADEELEDLIRAHEKMAWTLRRYLR